MNEIFFDPWVPVMGCPVLVLVGSFAAWCAVFEFLGLDIGRFPPFVFLAFGIGWLTARGLTIAHEFLSGFHFARHVINGLGWQGVPSIGVFVLGVSTALSLIYFIIMVFPSIRRNLKRWWDVRQHMKELDRSLRNRRSGNGAPNGISENPFARKRPVTPPPPPPPRPPRGNHQGRGFRDSGIGDDDVPDNPNRC